MKTPTRHVALALLALPALASAQIAVRSAAGADASAIVGTVAQFRTDLGGGNNGVNAHAGSDGRREINWDGVPVGFTAPNTLNANFFNQNSQRGLQLVATPGVTGFMVSDGDASNSGGTNGAGVRFDNLNSSYSSQFTTLTPQKLFTSLGSHVYDVTFFVPLNGPALPGSTAAVVSGFGAVFTDVDVAGTTSLQFFDANGQSLGAFAASPAAGGLSFLGAYATDGVARIARVRVTQGNTPMGVNDDLSHDIVAVDDFIYGEPVGISAAVPEPASVSLMALGGVALLLWRRRGGQQPTTRQG